MINFKIVKGRRYWGMTQDDLTTFAEIIWLLKHSPPPIGFNRKPLTSKQVKIVDAFYEWINYEPDYAEQINKKTGQ